MGKKDISQRMNGAVRGLSEGHNPSPFNSILSKGNGSKLPLPPQSIKIPTDPRQKPTIKPTPSTLRADLGNNKRHPLLDSNPSPKKHSLTNSKPVLKLRLGLHNRRRIDSDNCANANSRN